MRSPVELTVFGTEGRQGQLDAARRPNASTPTAEHAAGAAPARAGRAAAALGDGPPPRRHPAALRRPVPHRGGAAGPHRVRAHFEVEIDSDLRIRSRTLDGRTVPYESLSGGAKEQLGIVARLAGAALVAKEDAVPVRDRRCAGLHRPRPAGQDGRGVRRRRRRRPGHRADLQPAPLRRCRRRAPHRSERLALPGRPTSYTHRNSRSARGRSSTTSSWEPARPGAVVANRLSADPAAAVVVLEAGPAGQGQVHPHPGGVRQAVPQRGRLGLPDRTAEGARRPRDLLAARQNARRLVVDERDDVGARFRRRLRRVGASTPGESVELSPHRRERSFARSIEDAGPLLSSRAQRSPRSSTAAWLAAVRECGYRVEQPNRLRRRASAKPWSPSAGARGGAPPTPT